jgi:hypothetical protein
VRDCPGGARSTCEVTADEGSIYLTTFVVECHP